MNSAVLWRICLSLEMVFLRCFLCNGLASFYHERRVPTFASRLNRYMEWKLDHTCQKIILHHQYVCCCCVNLGVLVLGGIATDLSMKIAE